MPRGLIMTHANPHTQPILLSVKNLSVSYDTEPIFHNVSFDMHKGDVIMIIGPNGAGKTTLVKLICKIYKANEGEILINDRNILEYKSLNTAAQGHHRHRAVCTVAEKAYNQCFGILLKTDIFYVPIINFKIGTQFF